MTTAARGSLALIGAAFFASGAAALAFENLWFHQAALAFGNSAVASSLVLSGFMAGAALGNQLAARLGDRLPRVLRAFAWLELLVAGSGFALVWLLPRTGGLAALALSASPLWLNALRFASAFALLLVPAAAMGMTLPLLTRALAVDYGFGFGRALSLLYGVNTLGAVCGTLATEQLLLANLGVYGSAACAAALDLFAAALGALLARRVNASGGAAATSPSDEPAPPLAARSVRTRLLLAAALAGAALLALEVVWLRIALLFLNDTPLAFAWVLACVLAGIALGSLASSIALSRSSRAAERAPLVAYAAGACAVLGYRLYPWFLAHGFRPDQDPSTILALTAPLVLSTAIASGALFGLLGDALRKLSAAHAAAAGQLVFANTLGATFGPWLAAFVLLPQVGMERALFVLAVLYGAVGLLSPAGPSRMLRAAGFSVFALVLCAFPFGAMRASFLRVSASRWMQPGDQLVRVREGVNATYVQIEHRLHGVPLFEQIATNAYSMTVDDYAARRYMELFAFLPYALHPRIERALCIGYGMGNTARAITLSSELKRLDVVDIAPEMLALARSLGKRPNPLDDPRVHVQIEDGRRVLAAGGPGYDLITGEPPPPIIAGVGNLYSEEYFALVRARLAPGGIATYWLPMMNISGSTGKALIHAFCSAFDDCSLWHASARNLMLMGTATSTRAAVSDAQFARGFESDPQRAELNSIGFETPGQLGALFIGGAAYLNQLTADTPPLSDDWPKRLEEARDDEARASRDALLWEFRDTRAARGRFAQSELVARLFPPGMLRASQREFENQRLINDLSFPGESPARQVGVLDQVLQQTSLRFPILLLLASDPDRQRALLALPESARDGTLWLWDRLAGALADRRFGAARALVEAQPDAKLALPGLREYVMRGPSE